MVCVVSPVDHKIPLAMLEVKLTEFPSQKVSGPFAEIVGACGGVTVFTTTLFETDEQPLPSVKVTK